MAYSPQTAKFADMNLTGQVFVRWEVLGLGEHPTKRGRWWLCRCICGSGAERLILTADLVNGTRKGCGCLRTRTRPETDLAGQKIGLLTVGQDFFRKNNCVHWYCQCECGESCIRTTSSLIDSKFSACDKCKVFGRAEGSVSLLSEYRIWKNMIERCHNPDATGYVNYGGRGISVCERWREDFRAFFLDVGNRPSLDHSLDRINNDGNYESGNVRWITKDEQGRNRRTNKVYNYEGHTLCIAAWAEHKNIPVQLLKSRLRAGWSIEKALTAPVDTSKWTKATRAKQGAK